MTSTSEWKEIFSDIVKYTSFHDVSNIKTIEDVKKVCDEVDNKCHKKGVQSTLTRYHKRAFEDLYYQTTQQTQKVKHKITKQTLTRKHHRIEVYRDSKGRFMKKP